MMQEIATVVLVWVLALLACCTLVTVQKAIADYDRSAYEQHFIDVSNGVKP